MSLHDRVLDRWFAGRRPGRAAVRLPEPGGSYDLWVFDGDAIEVYAYDGNAKRVVVRRALSVRSALRIAWFIIWKWWVVRLWFGLKLRAWLWATRKRIENSKANLPGVVVDARPRFAIGKKLNGAHHGP